MDRPEEDFESDLIDVSDIGLDRLDELPSDALGEALHRILRESDEDPDAYAGFQNSC